jgi:ATP-dependent RNA helicase DeaD
MTTPDVSEEASPDDPSAALTSGSFAEMGLPDDIMRGIAELGYKAPTDVQRVVMEPVTGGADVIVQARTGSGKTTAFGLPVQLGIDSSRKVVQAIVLCPTRELANQVSTEVARIGRFSGTKVVAIYGGASMTAQIDALEAGAQFVVGTPGRVKDLLRRGHLKLGNVKFAVLDEADEMLSMGFWEEVTSILDQLPRERQTLLFSATLPPAIERAAKQYLNEPKRLDLSSDSLNVTTIRHLYHLDREDLPKPRNFLYILEFHRPRNAIVFCNRRDETEMICAYLRRFGFRAEALNGDMPQRARERVLAKVKAGELDMMVATDVAARGIDISDLEFVFNYDLPDFDEVYVHRVGRTGRIGKKGTAVSLVRGRYQTHLTTLTKQFEVPFEQAELPPDEEIIWMQAERLATQLIEEADGVEMTQYRPVAESMLERGDIKEIVAFLLRSHFSQKREEGETAEARRERDSERSDRGDRDRRPRRDRDRGERRPRRDRGDEGSGEGEAVEAADGEAHEGEPSPHASLYVTLGREDGLADLAALLAKLSEMSGVDEGHFTGQGDLRDHSSHVEVDTDVADQIIEGVHGKPRGDEEAAEAKGDDDGDGEEGDDDRGPRTIVCERARPRKPRRRRSGGSGGGGGRGRRPRK